MKRTGLKAILSVLLFLTISFCFCKNSYAEESKNVTASGILVKTGDVYELNTKNIDGLLEQAGSDYKSKYTSIFHGRKVSVDSEFVDMCSVVGVVDGESFETLELLYVTSDELTELMKKMDDGPLAKEYEVSEAFLVEAAEGYAYCARFSKAGKTTITIKEYEVSDDEKITVTIPVTVLPDEITTETLKIKVGDTFNLSSTEFRQK